MSRKDRNFWIEQAKDRLLSNERQADQATRELFFLYDEAAHKIESQINSLAARYADQNQLTREQAARLLSGQEHSTWKKSIEKYLKDISKAAADSKTLLELNTLAMKSRISRQEELLADVYRQMMELASGGTQELTGLLSDIVRTNYYRSGYDIQRGIGMGFNVAKINEKLVRQVIEYPWSTKHFSKSLWEKTDTLAALAKREITFGFINGSSVQKIAKEINDVMGKGKYAAERLVRTECKYFANQGELLGYRANGVKRYRFVGGSEGSGHCDCADVAAGGPYNVDEAEAGINYPPLHPNCVCIVIADFDSNMFDAKRSTTPLQENISFQRWKEKFVS